jgi:hypothetical protein
VARYTKCVSVVLCFVSFQFRICFHLFAFHVGLVFCFVVVVLFLFSVGSEEGEIKGVAVFVFFRIEFLFLVVVIGVSWCSFEAELAVGQRTVMTGGSEFEETQRERLREGCLKARRERPSGLFECGASGQRGIAHHASSAVICICICICCCCCCLILSL